MFDRCRVWRQQISRRADGTLPPARWGALEAHLSRCPSCRAAAEADEALHDVLSRHNGLLSPQQATVFDARVLQALALPQSDGFRGVLSRLLRNAQARANAMPLTFFSQIASGALVAASLTVVCVLSALRPAVATDMSTVHSRERSALTAAYNEPPVPLESLLEHPSPRAALLWTTPSGSRSRIPGQGSTDAPARQDAPRRPAGTLPADHGDTRSPDRG